MDNLIERNKNIQKKRHLDDLYHSQQSELRHSKNVMEENKRLNQKALRNEEKIFKKYMTFYFYRKGREKQLKLKNTQTYHKFDEKAEKLEEMEKKYEMKTKEFVQKLNDIEKRKREILKHKNDKIKMFNKKRHEYYSSCVDKRKNMLKELSDIRADILDYQTCVLQRNTDKIKLVNLKKMQSNEKTLNDQLNFEKNLKPFYKKLEIIKSDCVMRKSVDDRRKIYILKKKKEAELKKEEEEKKLLNLNKS